MTYVPNGTPLTDHEKELMTILMEEAAEVILAASKIIRFGRENRPDSGESNVVVLSMEWGELEHVAERAAALGLFDAEVVAAGRRRKRERLAYFMQTKSPFPDKLFAPGEFNRLPMPLRNRYWEETKYGELPASDDLMKSISAALEVHR